MNTFQYLGSMITEDAEIKEIRGRLSRGQSAETGMKQIWKSHSIKLTTKVRLMKALVWPVATYGCESWFTLNSARTFRRPSFQRTQLGAANHSAYSTRRHQIRRLHISATFISANTTLRATLSSVVFRALPYFLILHIFIFPKCESIDNEQISTPATL